MEQSPKFKVGDRVGSTECKNKDTRWIVAKVNADGILLMCDRGDLYPVVNEHLGAIFHDECQHRWKRLDLFRTTEFHCINCKAMRPFDKEKDEAA